MGEPTHVSWEWPSSLALFVSVALTLWLGVQAQALLALAQRSVAGLF